MRVKFISLLSAMLIIAASTTFAMTATSSFLNNASSEGGETASKPNPEGGDDIFNDESISSSNTQDIFAEDTHKPTAAVTNNPFAFQYSRPVDQMTGHEMLNELGQAYGKHIVAHGLDDIRAKYIAAPVLERVFAEGWAGHTSELHLFPSDVGSAGEAYVSAGLITRIDVPGFDAGGNPGDGTMPFVVGGWGSPQRQMYSTTIHEMLHNWDDGNRPNITIQASQYGGSNYHEMWTEFGSQVAVNAEQTQRYVASDPEWARNYLAFKQWAENNNIIIPVYDVFGS